jgi:3-methyladenine DNA glycosylase AlkC
LWALFKDEEGVKRASFNGIKLCLPQGKSLTELQAVR